MYIVIWYDKQKGGIKSVMTNDYSKASKLADMLRQLPAKACSVMFTSGI